MSGSGMEGAARGSVAGEVVGYRTWALEWNGALRSMGRGGDVWFPGQNTARCAAGHDHRAPDPDCECGLYALHRPDHRQLSKEEIWGAVSAWGELQVYRDGFRAEHARVVALVKSGFGSHKRRAEEAAARRYGVLLVSRGQLETVAGEHGSPVAGELREQTRRARPVTPAGRRGTRSEQAYEPIARRVRAVPGLRTALLCAHAYGVVVSVFVWALMVVELLRAHPHPARIAIGSLIAMNLTSHPHRGGVMAVNLLSWGAAGLPMLVSAAIWKARQLAQSRTAELPWPARLQLPLVLAVALCLPWLPGSWPAVVAATWLIGIASGTLVAAAVLYAIQNAAYELVTVMLPGLAVATALANYGAPARALIASVWIASHSALIYADKKLGLA